jgi:hypothetical protein
MTIAPVAHGERRINMAPMTDEQRQEFKDQRENFLK